MAKKYIDAEKLLAEIERLYDGEAPKHDQQCDFDSGYFAGIGAISRLIDSLQQEPPINTELCTLIACDVIQATAKRAIETPQDKDKEEDLMIKKMEYLNMLEKSSFQQEQPEVDGLEEELENYAKLYPLEDAGSYRNLITLARHFAEWGAKNAKQ